MICNTADELRAAFDEWLATTSKAVAQSYARSWQKNSAAILERMRNHPVYGRHSRGYRKHVRRMKATGGNYSPPPVVRTVDLTKSVWAGEFKHSSNVRVMIGE